MIFASIDLNKKYLNSFLESLKDIKDCKFNGIEICPWEDMNRYSEEIKNELCKLNLQTNIHNDLMQIKNGIKDCEKRMVASLRLKKNLDSQFFISHPIKPYLPNMIITKNMFNKIGEEILLENVKGIRSEQIKFFDMPLVLDIGNTIKNEEYNRLFNYNNVKWIHLHDYKDGQDHLPLGKGALNLNPIIKNFSKIGFTLELGSEFRKWDDLKEGYKDSIDYLNNQLIFNESYGKNVRLEHLLKNIKNDKFDVAIDFGCGEGYLLHNLPAKTKKGYDILPRAVFNDITYTSHDLVNPLNECADFVICSEVIEHVQEDKKVLKNIHNILKSGGKIFLTTINKNISKDKSKLDKERNHFRRYDEKLRNLIETQGFKTLSFYPFRSTHYYMNKGDFENYKLEEDIKNGEKEASGWVYYGVKK
ncbi:MAG: methyltransferase domain-containing protein [Nanobdellota archaeon]